MIRRCFAILIVAWSLWAMPTLCVAGVLEHACAVTADHCERVSADSCSHASNDSGHDDVHASACHLGGESTGGGCGHEADCSSDPCAETTATCVRQQDDVAVGFDQPVLFAVSVNLACDAWLIDDCGGEGVVGALLPLVVHFSDLPLLI